MRSPWIAACVKPWLGAGLDTFGLRNPHAHKGLRVFEADRPAAQQWKRECLAKANLTGLGFSDIEDLAPVQVFARYGIQRDPDAPGGHIVWARRGSDPPQ